MPHPPVITAAKPIAWAAGAAFTAATGSGKRPLPIPLPIRLLNRERDRQRRRIIEMSSNPEDKPLPESSEIQSLTSRLRDMERALQESEEKMEEEVMPEWDSVPLAEAAPPEPSPVEGEPAEELAPVTEETPAPPEPPAPVAEPVSAPVAPPRVCPICAAERREGRVYCDDCC